MPRTSDISSCGEDYERFIESILETELVWTLVNDEGHYANSESNDINGVAVLLFWSDKDDATKVQKRQFPGFKAVTISLFDFIFRWLNGMEKDNALVGPNFTDSLFGREISPVEFQELLLNSMPEEQQVSYLAKLRLVQVRPDGRLDG